MKKSFRLAAVLALALAAAASAHDQQQGMPALGAPEQMKPVTELVGTWDVAMSSKHDPSASEWTNEKGVCTFTSVLDGCAVQMQYKGLAPTMGIMYQGLGLQTFDRESAAWQFTWTDNMMARTVLYVGEQHGDTVSGVGEEMWQGQKYLARISTFNRKPDSFDWQYEMSMDGGKNWMVSAKAVYTRQK